MKTTKPILNQAYALIIEDESQNSNSNIGNRGDHVAMQAGRGQLGMQNNIGQQYKGKKPFVKCEYCNKPGHSKENYYKLIGYPTDFKNKRSYAANIVTRGSENDKPTQQDGEKGSSDGLKVGPYFTKEWIIDSGATHHIAHDLDVLETKDKFQDLYNGKVMGIGREKGGLYILKKVFKGDLDKFVRGIKQFASTTTTKSNEEDGALWHRRLGHASLKSDVVVVLKKFLYMLLTQFQFRIKVIRTDNGRNCFNKHMKKLFDVYGISYQRSCVYTPQQNGVMERKHRHILDISRPLKFQASILQDSRYPPNGADLQPERVGDSIPDESTEPRSYDAHTSVDTEGSEEDVEEDAHVKQVLPVVIEDNIVGMPKTGVADSIPDDADIQMQELHANISTLTDPKTFSEASKDKRWIEAMEMEIKALEDNKIWSIVDLPKGEKAIGSKWVYKIKYKASG
ncbi:uncharacterized protein [Nicotiana tomentosiformis]|uniref:uncharacterized protein n=1 Tax=Nicotiana tomentosiformis TaxID=4098 RepID=UPI00388C8AE1